MTNDHSWPFDMDLSTLDTASITNILSDIEKQLPLMETDDEVCELLKVKELFEKELMVSRRLH